MIKKNLEGSSKYSRILEISREFRRSVSVDCWLVLESCLRLEGGHGGEEGGDEEREVRGYEPLGGFHHAKEGGNAHGLDFFYLYTF
eukprot:1369240-Amorphochlora_amoeboformis.AAC.1